MDDSDAESMADHIRSKIANLLPKKKKKKKLHKMFYNMWIAI